MLPRHWVHVQVALSIEYTWISYFALCSPPRGERSGWCRGICRSTVGIPRIPRKSETCSLRPFLPGPPANGGAAECQGFTCPLRPLVPSQGPCGLGFAQGLTDDGTWRGSRERRGRRGNCTDFKDGPVCQVTRSHQVGGFQTTAYAPISHTEDKALHHPTGDDSLQARVVGSTLSTFQLRSLLLDLMLPCVPESKT